MLLPIDGIDGRECWRNRQGFISELLDLNMVNRGRSALSVAGISIEVQPRHTLLVLVFEEHMAWRGGHREDHA